MTILWLSFVESFSTILLERGVYFYTTERFAFSAIANLWLALLFGLLYAVGAATSHHWLKFGHERRVLGISIGVLLLLHGVMALSPSPDVLVPCFGLIGLAHGAKWPFIESYVGAGRTHEQMPRALSHFNLAWALAVPPAISASGAMSGGGTARSLFVVAGLANVLSLLLVLRLPLRPAHLPHAEHRDHPQPFNLGLLRLARWGLLGSYTLLFLLAPLLPKVLGKLGIAAERAGFAAAALDGARVFMFALVGTWTAWRGRLTPLVVALALLPFGALSVLLGPGLPVVLLGEVSFGIASGFIYSASLYYVLVAERAQVSAGGSHEGLIGLGLAIGPALGLCAEALTR